MQNRGWAKAYHGPGVTVVSEPPRYADNTTNPVEYFAAVDDAGRTTGYLWLCDADDAAGFEPRKAHGDNFNIRQFWYRKLLECKARSLTPVQAVQELFAEPGRFGSGRLVPESRAVTTNLAALTELAAEGWTPPPEPVVPPGWRRSPRIDQELQNQAKAGGGWLYLVDDGYDRTGRVPPHAVQGGLSVYPDGFARGFWNNPAYGQALEPTAEPGEASPVPPLGAGRRPAGLALLSWLEDPNAPRFCRIAGSSGSGRTHLLTWLASACPPDNPHRTRRVHALLSARGLTVRSATWMLGDQLGLPARTPTDLMDSLQDGVTRTIVITDLDLAGDLLLPGMAERIITELLTPLLQVPWLRLLVEAESGRPAASALSAVVPREAVIDLDEPQWTDRDRYAEWCSGLGPHPVPVDQVYPSPALAHLAARTPADDDLAADLESCGTPGERAGVMVIRWQRGLPEDVHTAVRTLGAAERPLPQEVWAALPGSGGRDAVTRATGYLPPPPDGRTWRLTPEVLANDARKSVDHHALVRDISAGLPRGADGRPDFASAAPELLGVLLWHALYASATYPLLHDSEFLCRADLAAVTAVFEYVEPGDPIPPREELLALCWETCMFGPGYDMPVERPQSAEARAWHLAGPASETAERTGALHAFLSELDQQAADQCAAISGQRWRVAWSYRLRYRQQVRWMTICRGPLAGRFMAVVDDRVCWIDPQTGQQTEGAEAGRMSEHEEVDVAWAEDGNLLMLKAKGTVIDIPYSKERSTGLTDAADWASRTFAGLTAIGTADLADGPVLAIGDTAGTLACLWANHEQQAESHHMHTGAVRALDVLVADGKLLVASGGQDGRVCGWTGAHGRPAELIDARDFPVTAVAVADTPQGRMIAAAWADGLIRIRRRDTVVDLRLGLAAHSLAIDPSGVVCVALPDSVFGVTLDSTDEGMTRDAALARTEEFLRNHYQAAPPTIVMRPELTEEHDWAWNIHFDSKEWLDTQDPRYRLLVTQVVVPKDGSDAHFMPSAFTATEQKQYLASGRRP